MNVSNLRGTLFCLSDKHRTRIAPQNQPHKVAYCRWLVYFVFAIGVSWHASAEAVVYPFTGSQRAIRVVINPFLAEIQSPSTIENISVLDRTNCDGICGPVVECLNSRLINFHRTVGQVYLRFNHDPFRTRRDYLRKSQLDLISKKRENFKAAVGRHFAYYNFVKPHHTLRCTPAMAAGVVPTFWSVGDLVEAAR